jgi:predicted CXXCH cytochrome family protein
MRFLLVGCLLLFVAPSWATEAIAPKLDIGKGGQCVRDPQWMRKNHMHLLKHQRDETVRKGIRVEQDALKNCVECHASTRDDSVTAREDSFCVGCHRYAAVRIDCFECHASKRRAALAMKDVK